ncbi:MAG: hypothetical protein IPL08_13875 [Saprospiraceae bacterium]|nr:hypothetical protein [Saprospiraceae bacterium]
MSQVITRNMEDKKIKQMVDDSWNKMSILLDAEMPVENKRRRPAIFWWYGAAAATVAIVSFSTLFLHHARQQKSFHSEFNNTVSSEEATSHSESCNSKSGLGTDTLYNDVATTVMTQRQQHLPDKRIIVSTSKIIFSEANTSFHADVPYESTRLHTIEPVMQIPTDMKMSPVAANIPKRSEIVLQALTTSKTSFLKSGTPDKKVLELSLQPTASTNTKKHSPWRLAAEAGILTHDYQSLLAMHVGMSPEYRLSSKWSLMSSIKWRQYFQSSPLITDLSGSAERNQPTNSNVDPSGSGVFDIQYDPIFIHQIDQKIIHSITQHLSYLEWGGGVRYHLSERFSVLASGFAAKLIFHQYSSSLETSQLLSIYNKSLFSQEYLDSQSPFHHTFLIGWQAGAGFHLTDRFSIEAKANIFTAKNDYTSNAAAYDLFESANAANDTNFTKIPNDHRIGVEFVVKYYFR